MGEDRLQQAVLTGSAAQRWPVDGCRCVSCTLATSNDHPARPRPRWGLPNGLELPGLLTVDGALPASGSAEADQAPGLLPRLITSRTGAPRARWLAPGERAELGAVRVVALPAGTPEGEPDADRVVLVLGCGPRALLWAAGSGPLPAATLEALAGADLVAAVLDAGPADVAGPGPRPRPGSGPVPVPGLGLTPGPGLTPGLGLAHQVARLRASEGLADDVRLIAVGLSHHGPPPHRFAATAAQWGVDVLPDGTPLWPAECDEDGPIHAEFARLRHTRRAGVLPRRTVILGAAASGKSLVAESLLAARPEVVYVATGPQPDDDDPAWSARVAEHRRRRPPWWRTVEGGDLVTLLTSPGPPLLVDSLGTWLTSAMTDVGCWDDRSGWQADLRQRVDALVDAWRQAARPVVAVAEEVGWGVVPATASGGHFRDALGNLNRRISDQSEQVLLVVAGRTVDLDAAGDRARATGWEGQ